MPIIGIFTVIGMIFVTVFFTGVRFWIKRHGRGILLLYASTVAAVWWAGHYCNQLPMDARGDLLWHRRYTLTIMIIGPLAILLSAIIGYAVRMKKYFQSGGATEDKKSQQPAA